VGLGVPLKFLDHTFLQPLYFLVCRPRLLQQCRTHTCVLVFSFFSLSLSLSLSLSISRNINPRSSKTATKAKCSSRAMENKLGFCWFREGSVLGFHEQKNIHSSLSILDTYSIHKVKFHPLRKHSQVHNLKNEEKFSVTSKIFHLSIKCSLIYQENTLRFII